MAGGWRYLSNAGCHGAWGLVVCTCWLVCVRCLWCWSVSWSCCVRLMAAGGGGGPARAVRSLGGALRLVEQEFEEVGLVCWG